jgi:hypothetical protein
MRNTLLQMDLSYEKLDVDQTLGILSRTKQMRFAM